VPKNAKEKKAFQEGGGKGIGGEEKKKDQWRGRAKTSHRNASIVGLHTHCGEKRKKGGSTGIRSTKWFLGEKIPSQKEKKEREEKEMSGEKILEKEKKKIQPVRGKRVKRKKKEKSSTKSQYSHLRILDCIYGTNRKQGENEKNQTGREGSERS